MIVKFIFENVILCYLIYNLYSLLLCCNLVGIVIGGWLMVGSGQVIQVIVLENVFFSLCSGDVVGIVGYNGVGKSIMLCMMVGIYMLLEGCIEWVGCVVIMFEVGVGMDFELFGYENICCMGMMFGLLLKEINVCIFEIEEFIDFGDFLQLVVWIYLVGMVMCLMFVVVICIMFDILLVDEVFDVGDEVFKECVVKCMCEFIKFLQIFCLVLYLLEMIVEYCNWVFVLNYGMLWEILVL